MRDLSEKFGYEPVRFMLLQVQYRVQLNYTEEVMESAAASLTRLKNCRAALKNAIVSQKKERQAIRQGKLPKTEKISSWRQWKTI